MSGKVSRTAELSQGVDRASAAKGPFGETASGASSPDECLLWAVSVDRHQGRKPDTGCNGTVNYRAKAVVQRPRLQMCLLQPASRSAMRRELSFIELALHPPKAGFQYSFRPRLPVLLRATRRLDRVMSGCIRHAGASHQTIDDEQSRPSPTF